MKQAPCICPLEFGAITEISFPSWRSAPQNPLRYISQRCTSQRTVSFFESDPPPKGARKKRKKQLRVSGVSVGKPSAPVSFCADCLAFSVYLRGCHPHLPKGGQFAHGNLSGSDVARRGVSSGAWVKSFGMALRLSR